MPKTNLELIKENLPGIASLTIILGYLDLHFYYKRFGINIYPYLDASEILFSFGPLLTVLIPILFYLAVFSSRVEESKFKIDFARGHRAVSILLGLVLVIVLLIMLLGGRLLTYYEDAIIVSTFLGTILLAWAVIKWVIKRPLQIALNVAGVLCFFLSVGFILAINWIKAQQILDGRKKFDVELTRVVPYPEIRTADDILYVGSTKNYIFFKTPDGSMVVPRAQVIELKQKKVRYGL